MVMTLLPLLRRFWPAILVLLLLAYVAIVRSQVLSARTKTENALTALKNEQAGHIITLDSVKALRKAADDANAAVAAQADYAVQQRATAAANAKLARDRNASLLATAARLERDAKANGACATSRDILGAGL